MQHTRVTVSVGFLMLYLSSWVLVYPLAHIVHAPIKNYELFAFAAEFLNLKVHAT